MEIPPYGAGVCMDASSCFRGYLGAIGTCCVEISLPERLVDWIREISRQGPTSVVSGLGSGTEDRTGAFFWLAPARCGPFEQFYSVNQEESVRSMTKEVVERICDECRPRCSAASR